MDTLIEVFAGKVAAFHDETTLMMSASRVGRTEIIATAMELDPELDINVKNFRGQSAFILAAEQSHTDTLKYLLGSAKNLDVAIQDSKGNTALHYAAKNGNLEAMKAILDKYVC
jgi:ankyrin repeat protein